MKDYVMEKKLDREYKAWTKEQLKIIPELASRVFALRSKGYMGCGCHYAMEKKLGDVISRLNNYDYYGTPDENMMFRMCTKIELKMLIESVEKAEASVKELTEKNQGNHNE